MNVVLPQPHLTVSDALTYASNGWQVFPIRPRTKRPHNRHGSTEATDDFEQVSTWWHRWPRANVGALVPQRLVVVDLDPRNGCTITPDDLPGTLTVATGGGGWHLYYRRPSLDLHKNASTHPGVDMITSGRQVILPPSLHPSGEFYRWANNLEPAAMPSHLARAFERSRRRIPDTSATTDDGAKLIARQLADLPHVGNGRRNERTRAVAWFAGRIVGAGLLDESTAHRLVLEAAPIGDGFSEQEAAYTIRRAVADGARDPLPVEAPTRARRR